MTGGALRFNVTDYPTAVWSVRAADFGIPLQRRARKQADD